MRRWTTLVLVVAAAGCTAPEVQSVTVASADGFPVVHTDGGLRVTAEVKPGSNSRSPLLTISPVAPAGSDVSRPLQQGGTSGGIETHTSVTAAGDPSLPLPMLSTWTARVDVPWTFLFVNRTASKTVPFQVLESRLCFNFLAVPGSAPWTLSGYFHGDASTVVSPITPATFAPANFPQPFPGDQSFGFTISSIITSGFGPNDYWSAEFISPPLSGMNPAPGWAEMHHYKLQVRTNAVGMRLQPIITKLTGGGATAQTFKLLDANHNPVFFNLPSDGGWHEFEVNFIPQALPLGHVYSTSLRVFGRKGEINVNTGKQVMIDQVCRVP